MLKGRREPTGHASKNLMELFADMCPGWNAVHCGQRLVDALEAQLPITNGNAHGGATKESGKRLLGFDKRPRPLRR